MKKILLLLFVFTQSFSQIGIKAGVNLSTMSYADATIDVADDDYRDPMTLGFFMSLPATLDLSDNLSLFTEISYVQKGVSYSDSELNYSSGINLDFLEFSSSLSVYISEMFSLSAGIYSGMMLSGLIYEDLDGDRYEEDLDMSLLDNNWDFGVQAGPSVFIAENMCFDLLYKLGLSPVGDSEGDAELNHSAINIGFRYMFGY